MADLPAITGLFTRRWWVVLLRGIVAVIFGVLAFAWPHLTIAMLILHDYGVQSVSEKGEIYVR